MYDDDAARKRSGPGAQRDSEGKSKGGDSGPERRLREAEEAAEARSVERAKTHPARVAILGVLERHGAAEAGLTTRQVRERLDGDPSLATVAYHLLVLLRAKLVDGKRIDGAWREWRLA